METQTDRKTISNLPKIIKAKGYSDIRKVLVIGCGGTGGHVIPNLARMISVYNRRMTAEKQIQLFLADGDKVEEKNLIRQHFISSDINRNKAEIMAERYSAAFGVQITAIPKYLENENELRTFIRDSEYGYRSTLIVGCVDNNATRKRIHEIFSGRLHQETIMWIDSGNEETTGQVVCGINAGARGRIVEDLTGPISLPCATEIYPSLLRVNDKFSSELSCAERAQSAPQNMFTNVTAAALIMNFASKLINNEPLTSHAVEFSINNVFNTRLNTQQNLSTTNRSRMDYQEIASYDKTFKL